MALSVWKAPGSADWNTASNWAPLGVPTGDALFGDAPGSDYTVNVAFGESEVVGSIGIAPTTVTPTFSISGALAVQGSIVYDTNLTVTFDINSGGLLTVGIAIASFAPETMSIAGTGAGGTLRFVNDLGFNAPAPGMTFAFANNGPAVSNTGVIEFDNVAPLSSISQRIIDVAQGDEFVLPGNNYTGDTVSLDTSTHILTVTGSSGTVLTMLDVELQSGATNAFVASGDVIEALCFFAGTMITCPDGGRAVETLSIGDRVLTADGRCVSVKWIGRQTHSTKFGITEGRRPVCIAAGALGNNLPVRDLRLTADHALLIDNVLVQAGALVNGTTVRRIAPSELGERFVVYHIETKNHEVVLAEGAPAETFIDNVSRRLFDNYAEFESLYGDETPIVELDQPRAMSARQVPRATRERLATVARQLTPAAEEAAA